MSESKLQQDFIPKCGLLDISRFCWYITEPTTASEKTNDKNMNITTLNKNANMKIIIEIMLVLSKDTLRFQYDTVFELYLNLIATAFPEIKTTLTEYLTNHQYYAEEITWENKKRELKILGIDEGTFEMKEDETINLRTFYSVLGFYLMISGRKNTIETNNTWNNKINYFTREFGVYQGDKFINKTRASYQSALVIYKTVSRRATIIEEIYRFIRASARSTGLLALACKVCLSYRDILPSLKNGPDNSSTSS